MSKLEWFRIELAKERALLEALNAAPQGSNRVEIIADVENQIRELEDAIARFEAIIAAKSD